MSNARRQLTIGDLCDADEAHIQTGPFGSQLHQSDYVAEGVRVVATECIGHRRLQLENAPRVAPETVARLSRHRLRAGDILFARRGAQATGYSAIVEGNEGELLCSTGAILLRLKGSNTDTRFFSFLLAAQDSIDWLRQHSVGAVMPNLNETVIRAFPLELPPLSDQRAIARVLGALDEKIESNRRMNRTLEELASALFRSWFVDFDPVVAKAAGRKPAHLRPDVAALFPATFQDSPLGPIPHGWRVRPVPEVVEFNPVRRLGKGVSAPYLDMQNMPTSSALPDAWTVRPHGSGMKFQNGDTLLARITPCLENGKTAFVNALADGEVGWGSTEYIVMRPRSPLPMEYGYFLARSDDFRAHAIANMTGSSGRQRVPAHCFDHFLVTEPPTEIACAFGNIAAPFMRMMKAKADESRTLAALRDTLLPKLLSGELRVKPACGGMEVRA
jgi:type I restriction enzyme S subunit